MKRIQFPPKALERLEMICTARAFSGTLIYKNFDEKGD